MGRLGTMDALLSSAVLRDNLGGESGIFTAIARECQGRVTVVESSSYSKLASSLVERIVKGAALTQPGENNWRDR